MNGVLLRRFFALGLATTLACSVSAEDEPSDAEQLKALIPQATSIHKTVFDKIATDANAPTKKSFDEYSLTAAIMLLSIQRTQEVEGQDDFRYITGDRKTLKPTLLVKEMYHTMGVGRFRVVTKPVTMIQAERITDFAAKIDGDKATGKFAFHVPKLYKGKAKFTATRKNGMWEIQSFEMPGVQVHVALDDEGHWRDVAEQDADSAKRQAATR